MQPWAKWNKDFDNRLPIYQQIIERFCRAFVKGELQPGNRIPSIRDMALVLRVNANTVQRVYQELERQELIFSRRGCGYFITEQDGMAAAVQENMAGDSIGRFLNEMEELGLSHSRILDELTKRMKAAPAFETSIEVTEHQIEATDKPKGGPQDDCSQE